MSENAPDPSRNQDDQIPGKRKFSGIELGTIAATLVGLGSGVLAGYSVHGSQDKSPIAHLSYESKAKTESLAAAQAALFTAALYDRAHYPKSVAMPVLNGEIRTRVTNPNGPIHTGTYKDPLLLATNDIDAKPDVNGKFLHGAWIGIRGNDENGKAVIHAERYNPSNETFVPYTSKPTDLIFPDLGVYASADQGGPELDGLIGYDVTGQTQLTNGDGTIITPGLSTGMK